MINGKLKLKICGMRDMDNISEVAALKPDFMGFIFFTKSPRFVNALAYNVVQLVQKQGIELVAVFVNASVESVLQLSNLYGFTHVQLHGGETPETCAVLRSKGLKVFKAFPIAVLEDIEATRAYEGCCDYFLFDTKTPKHGGSGCQFDWGILQNYTGNTPFFLSGGIGPKDASQVLAFQHPQLQGIDLNSRFEISPAHKDAALLQAFINQLIFEKNTNDAK
jgi:phosphoribosylanthranilate isomerase